MDALTVFSFRNWGIKRWLERLDRQEVEIALPVDHFGVPGNPLERVEAIA